MKKIILMGRSEAGKTTLTQALRGNTIKYHKTQYINHFDIVIDTPGEYAQTSRLASALALYSYEADVIGLLIGANEPYSLFPPCVTAMANRTVIGIVTKIGHKNADVLQAKRWLELAGCKEIFLVDSKENKGIPELLAYLAKNNKNNTETY